MTLTKRQLRAAARHARELAMECVNGTAPVLDAHSYCGCATGEIVKRLHGVRRIEAWGRLYEEAVEIDRLLPWAEYTISGLVSKALFAVSRREVDSQHDALPFPLLALADALDLAAVGRPQRNPHE